MPVLLIGAVLGALRRSGVLRARGLGLGSFRPAAAWRRGVLAARLGSLARRRGLPRGITAGRGPVSATSPAGPAGAGPPAAVPGPVPWNRSRAAIFTPFSASLLPWPAAMVISQSVISPVSGSAATCPRNPSRRLDLHLRVCRACGSTVLITRSGATLRAIRHRPSVPSLPSAGSTSCPATSASSPSASAAASSRCGASGPVSSASTASASFTRALTRFSLAAGSSQSMSGLPGWE